MKLVTRAEWGAQPPKQPWTYVASTQGVKVHYEGDPVPADLVSHHEWCAGRVRGIQAAHMADTSQGWIDIAYTAVACPHGYVFEGRGLHHETGANGNQPLNLAHYAVCGMVGNSGLTQPSDDMLNGLRDAIEWLQQQGGAGPEIKGHRDGYPTDCPGGPLYAWVQRGAPRPGGGGGSGVGLPRRPGPGSTCGCRARCSTTTTSAPGSSGWRSAAGRSAWTAGTARRVRASASSSSRTAPRTAGR